MWTSLLLGLQAAAAQPAPPAPVPAEVQYVRVAGREERAMKLFASLAEGSPSAARVRAATIAPSSFERCAATPRAYLYGIDSECIRALVPEAGRGRPPVIALAVLENRRPNITGRVVLKGHTIWCIGPRSLGFEDLNDPLDGMSGEIGVQAKVDECIADALSVEREMVRDGEGRGHWLYAFAPDRLAENAQVARGSADGIATVRIASFVGGPRGPCRAFGTIEHVENGPALRAGDPIVIEMPSDCTRAHPMLAPLARSGNLVRFYGAWSGGVRFIEPVAAGGATP